jgi:NAD(P)H-dependent flavin oxidoreductase YrpB (nitropropane dioxygenase family)
VVAQGVEAGGHVRGTTPLLDLLDQVLGAVPVPVVAAGGICTGRRMAEALSAGAAAVRIGTQFVATAESDAHPDYVGALLAAGPLRPVTGRIDAMALYAGTGVADIGEVLPAAEVVSRLVAQARLRSV